MTFWLWLYAIVIGGICAFGPFVHLGRLPLAHLSGFQDDFFFYLTIARNIARTGVSTFDGTSLTNGYHPLWLGILTVLSLIADPQSVRFVATLQVLTLGLLLFATWLFVKVASIAAGHEPESVAIGGVVFIFLYAQLARTGMEVIVAIPALLAALWAAVRLVNTPSDKRLFELSLAASVCVLARIDTMIFAGLLAITIVWLEPRVRGLLRRPGAWLAISAGSLPLLVYVGANLAVFGMAMPQSGAAKQIQDGAAFNPRVLMFLFEPRNNVRDLVYFALVATLPTALTACGLVLVGFSTRRRERTLLLLPICGFALVYYLVLSFVSSWGLWIWYLYPLALGSGLTLCATLGDERATRLKALRRISAPVICVGLIAVTAAGVLTRDPAANPIHWSALRVAEFAREHPGTYAMGDRAGITGFLLPNGLVHLEGLVGPPSLLSMIREEAPLTTALQRYGVDYYVTTGPKHNETEACFQAEEPKADQSGERSNRMKAAICTPPLEVIQDPQQGYTYIFKVGPASR